jgi:hypothetical protein
MLVMYGFQNNADSRQYTLFLTQLLHLSLIFVSKNLIYFFYRYIILCNTHNHSSHFKWKKTLYSKIPYSHVRDIRCFLPTM